MLSRLKYLIAPHFKIPPVAKGMVQTYELDFEPIRAIVPNLVGREHQLRQIESYFEDERSLGPRIVILHGFGGIGKTQLASTYFNKSGLSYTSRFRLDGRDNFTFTSDFSRIAEASGLGNNVDKSVDVKVEDAWHWLNLKHNDRWLIMLDNVNDPGSDEGRFDVDELLKRAKHGSIIITTRLHNLVPNGRFLALEVQALDETNSLRVLEDNARRSLSDGKPPVNDLCRYSDPSF